MKNVKKLKKKLEKCQKIEENEKELKIPLSRLISHFNWLVMFGDEGDCCGKGDESGWRFDSFKQDDFLEGFSNE